MTVAGHLDEAIQEFEKWKVRVSSQSRLVRSGNLLREIAMAGRYPDDKPQLSVISEAIRHAQEFIEIANGLPMAPIPTLMKDLQTSVGGDLLPVSMRTGAHLQFQAQLWWVQCSRNRKPEWE